MTDLHDRVGDEMAAHLDGDAYEKDAGIDDDAPGSTYHHFHSKLLRLHENMNTEAGREIAAERHAFLEAFAERFEQEWYGED